MFFAAASIRARKHSFYAAAPGRDPDRERLEQTLSAQLGTPVAVRYEASGRGQLVVDFADLDILEGVLDRLGYRTY